MHCPACLAVPMEPLRVCAGRSPRVPCRLSVRWGLHRFACKREVDAPCSCRPFGGRLLRSGWRPAFRPVAAPPLVTCVRGFARRAPMGRLLSVNVGLLPLRRRPSGGGVCRRLSVPRGGGARRNPRPAIVTWLILPVVICLSQRLSHACLSINASIL